MTLHGGRVVSGGEGRFSSRSSFESFEQLELFVRRRSLVHQTRYEGLQPISIDAIGDDRDQWYATRTIEAGLEERVNLTENGGVGGANIFGKLPRVNVWRDMDATPGGVPRADSPLSPSSNLNLVLHTGVQLKHFGAEQVWAVIVLNNTTERANFVVTTHGVGR